LAAIQEFPFIKPNLIRLDLPGLASPSR